MTSSDGTGVTYDEKTGQWTLERELTVNTRYGTVVVPAGFQTDLASIPRVLWPLIAPFELSITAPIVHDKLYRSCGRVRGGDVPLVFTKDQCDQVFLDLMECDGVSWLRRKTAYYAVKAFGRGAFCPVDKPAT